MKSFFFIIFILKNSLHNNKPLNKSYKTNFTNIILVHENHNRKPPVIHEKFYCYFDALTNTKKLQLKISLTKRLFLIQWETPYTKPKNLTWYIWINLICCSKTNTALFFSSVDEIPSKIWEGLKCTENIYFNPNFIKA